MGFTVEENIYPPLKCKDKEEENQKGMIICANNGAFINSMNSTFEFKTFRNNCILAACLNWKLQQTVEIKPPYLNNF